MIIFVSDIRLNDNRSSTKLLSPFFDELIKYDHIILSPNALETVTKSGLNIVSFWLPFYKHKNLNLRLISEVLLPIFSFCCLINNKKIKISSVRKVITYSPSIFNVFFIKLLNMVTMGQKPRSFLILRDIFPDWAEDAGVIRNKYIVKLFRFFAKFQFTTFDVVGVQDKDALTHVQKKYNVTSDMLVLPNWLEDTSKTRCSDVSFIWQSTFREYKYNIIYTGNIGPAQNLSVILQEFLCCDPSLTVDTAIHIYGDGLEFDTLQREYGHIIDKNETSIYFWGSVSLLECEIALSNASAALFSLNNNLSVNNIPGKYMQYTSVGLPLLALVNTGNPVIEQIKNYGVGIACSYRGGPEVYDAWKAFLIGLQNNAFENSRPIYEDLFQFNNAAKDLIDWMQA